MKIKRFSKLINLNLSVKLKPKITKKINTMNKK